MSATVRLWSSAPAPTSAYLDACFIVDLFQHNLSATQGQPPAKPKRCRAADAFLARLTRSGCETWTSPLAVQEAMHAVSKSLIRSGAVALAKQEAFRLYRVLRALDVAIRWPRGAHLPRAGNLVVAYACLLTRRYGLVQPADALHAALVWYDGTDGMVTCDRDFYAVDPLTVYGFAPP